MFTDCIEWLGRKLAAMWAGDITTKNFAIPAADKVGHSFFHKAVCRTGKRIKNLRDLGTDISNPLSSFPIWTIHKIIHHADIQSSGAFLIQLVELWIAA